MRKVALAAALFIVTGITVFAQQSDKPYSVKGRKSIGLGTALNNTKYLQGNNSLYTEMFFDYGLGNFISTGVFVGYQKRQYSFYQYLIQTVKV